MTSEELWNEYCERTGTDRAQNHEAWAFCGGGAAADELLRLVLDGKKFGTASIYEAYLAEDEELPGERDYSVLLDARGEA